MSSGNLYFGNSLILIANTLENIELNEAQIEAVHYNKGPLVVIAGAGSGKTRVLTAKIAYLIKYEQIPPYSILALTFTNKASREMQSRISRTGAKDSKSLWIGTFHSIFSKILRIEAEKIGYTSNYTIYDTEDTKRILKQIVKKYNLDDKIYTPNIILSRISNAKNNLKTAQDYYDDPMCQADDYTAKRPMIGKIFLEYENQCFKSNAMDFDDILINTYNLFNTNPDVLIKYQKKFQYILIDEFQDTNVVQYQIIKSLAAIHKKVCVVGDDAQSIYGFRGANIFNMLNFEKDFPNARTFKLEQNYRSSKHIVDASNSVIKENKNQLKKNTWTNNLKGEPIFVNQYSSDIEESRAIAKKIMDLRIQNHLKYDKFAILYRTNTQSRSIEEELRKANIPYKIIGGLSFYQRKEIKDFLAYLRFLVNQKDGEALRRIINVPKRGIGPSTMDKISIAAADNNISVWDILCSAKHFFSGKVLERIEEFVDMFKASKVLLEKENSKKDAYEVASYIADRSGYLKELYIERTEKESSRYDNLTELLNGIKTFCQDPNVQDNSLENYLQEISLVSNLDEDESDNDRVTLMTVHSSKGLEFDHVFIAGMEENIFPSQLSRGNLEEIEEERRLFYVAITRAKNSLNISYAMKRFRFGKIIDSMPSRFIDEIDQSLIKKNSAGKDKNFFGYTPSVKLTNLINLRKSKNISPSNAIGKPLDPDFKIIDVKDIKVNQKVKHLKFGFGEVKKIEEINGSKKALVFFYEHGEKTLLLNFAKLGYHN